MGSALLWYTFINFVVIVIQDTKVRKFVFLFSIVLLFSACQKNNVSNVPYIALSYFGKDIIRVSTDTVYLEFSFTDGDADLGNDTGSHKYDIYIKDFRFDTGFAGYYFPEIDKSIIEPKKGISGLCLFEFYAPTLLSLRPDSIHANYGDTTHFEFYIMDRAGHTSNHITTSMLIMRP